MEQEPTRPLVHNMAIQGFCDQPKCFSFFDKMSNIIFDLPTKFYEFCS